MERYTRFFVVLLTLIPVLILFILFNEEEAETNECTLKQHYFRFG
jgi:hypothetical protein